MNKTDTLALIVLMGPLLLYIQIMYIIITLS